ncbi:hypothetical protein [Actinacidiphila sp. ITFR-21]|uniref:hypothetical protein n=1 Tax=Actinacidiphila sp. ITFR-21 TaxID=3075199 RepID=UPI0028896C35|nr:hypothetical protein [Streptomyces sp. ITFR-21]WNI20366.1 hypothetical protein RLT57_32705 [Streptomyces sp. ITFR-21]
MNNFLGSPLGTAGLAGALTVIIWFGTQPGGRLKPLGWGMALFLSMVAGSEYRNAGPPFNLVSSLVNDGIRMFGQTFPNYSMAGLALTMAAIMAYKKLTTRQVAMWGIVFWYVAAGAGGEWTVIADKIAVIASNLAS